MGATVVVDAFWGDSGKGKISAYLARKLDASFVFRAGTGTNAGHSIYFRNGRVVKTHQLPGAIATCSKVGIGSGVAVNPAILLKEIEEYGKGKDVFVDYRCPIITSEHIAEEQGRLKNTIGSTASGTGVALADFRLRKAKQAEDVDEIAEHIIDIAVLANGLCEVEKDIIIEGSQGTFLSLALSPDYPYVTSDNCTTVALVDDIGLNWKYIKDVVLVVKTMPTRVGPGYMFNEMTEQEIFAQGIEEYGVTTGRLRRKARGIDMRFLAYSVMLNGPTQIVLTFCDHYGIMKTAVLADLLEDTFNIPVTLLDTGKYFEDIQERHGVLG